MIGRPTLFSPGLAAVICERISSGETLKAICSEAEMPSQSTVFGWLAQHPDFSELYARAREASADVLVEEARQIADDSSADYVLRSKDGRFEVAVDHEHIARSKLRIEQRRWEAAKRKPRSYGERQHVEHSGSVQVQALSDEELVGEILELLETGKLKLPGGITLEAREEDDEPIA
jgi:hypothetical protein